MPLVNDHSAATRRDSQVVNDAEKGNTGHTPAGGGSGVDMDSSVSHFLVISVTFDRKNCRICPFVVLVIS